MRDANGHPDEALSRLFQRSLLDNFDYSVRTGVNQNWPIINDGIAIFANTVLRRDLIVGDACFRENCAYSYIPLVAVRRPVFFDDIVTEARTFIHTQNTRNTADDPSNSAAYNGADRACSALTFEGPAFNATS
jgi:hypothetical protein